MAKKQTRRSISVNRKVFDAFKVFCEANGGSMSSVTEQQLINLMGQDPRSDSKMGGAHG